MKNELHGNAFTALAAIELLLQGLGCRYGAIPKQTLSNLIVSRAVVDLRRVIQLSPFLDR